MDSGASALAPLLDVSTAGELIPELVRHGLQQLIELEVAAVLGAEHGYRPRLLTTQVGDIDLQIPKLRSGSFLPSILEPRRRVDQALYAVVMETPATDDHVRSDRLQCKRFQATALRKTACRGAVRPADETK